MTRSNKPRLSLVRPDDMEGMEAFVLKLTGERLTAEDRAKLEQALHDDTAAGDDFDLPDPDEDFDVIREKGQLVAYQDWDSSGPGGGAGRVSVYQYRLQFYALTDSGVEGPFESFYGAAMWSGILLQTDATIEIWIAPEQASAI